MTELLEQAFQKASDLPEKDQDAIAGWLLQELESERRWDESFADSQEMLSAMAADALRENREGKTELLDPDSL